MLINNVEDMVFHLTSILNHGLRLQQIEMDENLSIIIVATDLTTGEAHHTHLGFPENERLAKEIAKKQMDADAGRIIIN
jgi:hypothetical protein